MQPGLQKLYYLDQSLLEKVIFEMVWLFPLRQKL